MYFFGHGSLDMQALHAYSFWSTYKPASPGSQGAYETPGCASPTPGLKRPRTILNERFNLLTASLFPGLCELSLLQWCLSFAYFSLYYCPMRLLTGGRCEVLIQIVLDISLILELNPSRATSVGCDLPSMIPALICYFTVNWWHCSFLIRRMLSRSKPFLLLLRHFTTALPITSTF